MFDFMVYGVHIHIILLLLHYYAYSLLLAIGARDVVSYVLAKLKLSMLHMLHVLYHTHNKEFTDCVMHRGCELQDCKTASCKLQV